ncbi:hypothetical protein ABVK25_007489 [Lepraria finkii]|uniref:FAD-binding domain-containing protein n=1 Tax=Lepraria finkii TaxID=1340010 RepID=A0ABR4B3L2_9LECA
MAKSVLPSTWENGFKEPGKGAPWVAESSVANEAEDEEPHYTTPPSSEILTSEVHNELGLNVLRTWPTIYDGTNTPHDLPEWWAPSSEVDVLICGAGPSGLQVALSLVRQGVTFRIIDKAPTPLIAGRADGVQPRFLETLHSWGLATEVHEEGPLIEHTAIYKDGKKLLFARSHQSDSRYRGLHIITQGQIERIYIRDLLRHHKLVERQTIITDFKVESDQSKDSHPVIATLRNERSGKEESVRAKFLVASDGAASMVRKKLDIPFDGVSTEIYWGIMDCVFETDYPHAWVFGSVISSKHGGCVIIPREDGYIRLYTQLDTSKTGEIAKSRQANSESLKESGGRVDVNSITAEEVLEQANKIFAPYTLKFAAPLSWFAVWKISERVARSFSSKDNRVHLVGDAAHVHSVMGAFGLNASIMDSANLAWKLGLCALNLAKPSILLPTYDTERRAHANRIIRVSGSYLRFVCNSDFPLADFTKVSGLPDLPGAIKYTSGQDLDFLAQFFKTNGQFLLGVDAPYFHTPISPAPKSGARVAIAPKKWRQSTKSPSLLLSQSNRIPLRRPNRRLNNPPRSLRLRPPWSRPRRPHLFLRPPLRSWIFLYYLRQPSALQSRSRNDADAY